MSLDTMFTFELVLVALVIGGALAGAIYIGLHDRRIRRQTGRLVGTADLAVGLPVGLTPDELASGVTENPAPRQPPRREFYERIGLPRGAEMKIRLYSLNDYESELKGDGDAFGRDGYVAALKAYGRTDSMMLEDEWLECSPRKAAGLLGLAPGEYGVDEEHKAILLRRLPHGFPACARDCYIDPPVDS
jgi:hypothetical protein